MYLTYSKEIRTEFSTGLPAVIHNLWLLKTKEITITTIRIF